ncbi:CU044_5270 family protein [Umezawaea endophytica]|uniref:CU044_5270 family protein n=1 Tax=Umezawaea endophytica TaxID=1654476 RepID=A0A9X2VTP5_9PSEU|nr:CU044_5270 family protein [Umezawaea endophytica]MCS7482471.1 CU044_5270 family protein [Umezawaea endophytica]
MTENMWTEEELDRAIADQPAGPVFTAEARERALARMVAAGEAPRPVKRWLVAAAAVTLVAGALVAVPALWSDDSGPAASATETLRRAAAATTGQTRPSAGQYQYVVTHSWDLGSATTGAGNPISALFHSVREQWIPADRSAEWLERRATLDRRWLVGSDEQAKTEGDGGLLQEDTSTKERRGPCGDYPDVNEELGGDPDWGKPCAERVGNWGNLNPRFLSSLPTSPQALYDRLWSDSMGHAETALSNAAGVLASPEASPELRSALYQALQNLPDFQVTEATANLNGQVGTALGVHGDVNRYDIIIDPETGRYIGTRWVLLKPGTDMWEGLPAGTVVSFSAVDFAVVDRAGDEPPTK